MGEQEQVVKYIRGILVSSKSLLSLRLLRKDYNALIGENIPFAKFGYKTLEDFIKGTDSLDLVVRNGEPCVQARVTQQSAHISEMVQRQKSTGKKKAPTRVRFQLGHRAPRFYQPPIAASSSSKWRPKYSGDSWKQYRGSQRPQAVAHAQFVQKVSSKVVPTSNYNQVDPSVSQRAANNHINAHKSNMHCRPTVNQVLPKKDTMNDRLNHHRDGEVLVFPGRENEMTNGVPHPANNLIRAQNEYYQNGISQKSSSALSRENTSNGTASSTPVTPTTPLAPAVFDDVNPLVATKKRINRMMSELSLERDSGNCSPVSDISPPSPCKTPEEFPRTGDSMADLKTFAELHKLGEVEVSVKSVKHKKRGLGMVTCRIKVGKNNYTSYPNEFTTEEQAKKFCCEEALSDLVPKYQRRKSLLISSEKDILERMPQMLEKHQNGIWSWQLSLDYADNYNEQLPPDWLKVVDLSPSIQIEKLSDDYVLCHCEPGDAILQKGPNQQQRRSLGVPITNVSVPANTIKIGEDAQFYAQITCAMSAGEIWLQQVQTKESEDFTEMVGRMEVYYSSRESQLIPVSIVKTGHYVAKLEDQYYRVRAVEVNDTEVLCFFIDYGDELSIPKEYIFELKREYASVQAQAFVVRLAGLEDLYDISQNSKVLQDIIYKNVTVELAAENASPAEGDMSIRVYLNDIEEGKSLNEELISKLTMESASPSLYLQQEKVVEVYVSNIEANGDVYVQLRTYGFERFQQLKQNLIDAITANPPKHLSKKVTKTNSNGKLYFAQNVIDKQWHRIKLIDWSPDGMYAQIYYVDVGNTAVITVDKEILYPLESLSDIVNQYPPQATKVRMTGVDQIPEDFVETMTKLMPLEEQVLLKVVEFRLEHETYFVEFFTRNTDGGLFSINRSLSMKSELQQEEKSKSKLTGSSSSSKLVPSSGTLPSPKIPASNDFFPIAIPFAVNPYNFFVQPLETERDLNVMMERLQEKYRDVQYGGLKVEDIVPGNIYASKHDDGVWYRTSVIKVIHSGSVSVFFCDFGYYQNLTVQQLVPLDDEFLQLPYQALKAKIADIKPKHEKWSMDDCDQFKEMVEKKWFYSKVKEIEKDVFYESDVVLKLELIDTSTDEDIYIDKELIKNGIAIKA